MVWALVFVSPSRHQVREQAQHPSMVSASPYKKQDTQFSTSCGKQIIQYFLIHGRGGYGASER